MSRQVARQGQQERGFWLELPTSTWDSWSRQSKGMRHLTLRTMVCFPSWLPAKSSKKNHPFPPGWIENSTLSLRSSSWTTWLEIHLQDVLLGTYWWYSIVWGSTEPVLSWESWLDYEGCGALSVPEACVGTAVTPPGNWVLSESLDSSAFR